MSTLSKTTQDHEEIQQWCESRGGKPSHVKSTAHKNDPGILRIDFPGYSGEGSLEPITWEDFFKKFDEQGLAFVYQDKTADGKKSNFNKLISAENADTHEHSEAKSKTAPKSKTKKKTTTKAKGASHSTKH